MTDEQQTTMKAGDNPDDFTVDQVTAFLATADDAEKARVIEAEKHGQGRKGIVGEDEPAPEAEPESKPTVDTSKADTVEQAGAKHTEAQGEKYQKGYDGFVPSRDGDNPVDLTLAAVTGKDA